MTDESVSKPAEGVTGPRRVGVLTGGGDAPGLNAAVCGLCRRLARHDIELLGFRDGWLGLVENRVSPIDPRILDHLVVRGGSILGSSGYYPYHNPGEDVPKMLQTFKDRGLDALVAIGGDGTLTSADKLFREHQLPVVGVPKTIDNDLNATDFTFGFFTAVDRAMHAMDDLRTTAKSHSRIMVVECMGRHAGWITAYAGVAAAAEAILVPERPVQLEVLSQRFQQMHDDGKRSAIIAVAEGARVFDGEECLTATGKDKFGGFLTGGVAEVIAGHLQDRIGWESRAVVLGHLQRAGVPNAFDRVFALRLGARAARLVMEKRFGRMSALQSGEVVDVPLEAAVGKNKTLGLGFLDRYEDFFVPFPGDTGSRDPVAGV